jgi:hypothetical protein
MIRKEIEITLRGIEIKLAVFGDTKEDANKKARLLLSELENWENYKNEERFKE